MTDWANIFRAIQASDKYSDVIAARRFPGHATATERAKTTAHSHRVAKIFGLTLRPYEIFSRKPNTCGKGCTGLSPTQRTMAMSSTIGVFPDMETYITA
jgi:hypothetical protein